MDYFVYLASYITQKKVVRSYVGHCYCEDIRRYWMKRKPPKWMSCRSKESEIRFDVLEAKLPTKEIARASEALHAVRMIVPWQHSRFVVLRLELFFQTLPPLLARGK